jgi:hypothetical protein
MSYNKIYKRTLLDKHLYDAPTVAKMFYYHWFWIHVQEDPKIDERLEWNGVSNGCGGGGDVNLMGRNITAIKGT